MALTITQFMVGGLDDNFAYVLHDDTTKDCVMIDPSGDITELLSFIDSSSFKVTGVYITHTHFDHIDALPSVLEKFGDILIYVHLLGMNSVGEYDSIQGIEDMQKIKLGDSEVNVLHTPGHIDDAVCFYIDAENSTDGIPQIITGDTLFVGGCGRTSEHQVKDLYESLMELKALPAETIVYAGHDYGETPASTIGHEMITNKYYLAKNFNEFKRIRLG